MKKLDFAEVWRTTFADVRANVGLYGTLAAAFVLLPAMVVAVLGPGEARTVADLNGTRLFAQLVVALIGAVAQLAIIALACGTVPTPRAALARGFAALPGLAGASLLTAFAILPAVLLLSASRQGYPALQLAGLVVLLPGLYVIVRLTLAVPMLATRTFGPVTALRASWAATAGNGFRIFGFLAAIAGLLLLAMLLAGGVAAALGSVFKLVGAPQLANFVVALISAVVLSGYTVVNSVGLATLLKRLA
ncbi:hypothetical protein [Glacieibacterium frigidum]|uniref:Glycerophosphoryl diester phosphodiesterase membrane domain-containing protein n=1 Tax=Glacieibacterium frigidum TaxID=2593303 RepID=A0A552UFS4_9SPHN|nr:hypothetical protein [Glacieibacterium frigidum]TRW17065.1 hypothetical protein FMM06_02320 [Glacieibacterium frigidum]